MIKLKYIFVSLVLIFSVLSFALAAPKTSAASGSIYLVSPTGSVNQNGKFTVGIRENSGSLSVNAAQANLSYSTDKLEFVSISGDSAFNIAVQGKASNGIVQITKGSTKPLSGDQLITNVTFKAKSQGTANIGFSGGTMIVGTNNSGNILSWSSGLSIPVGKNCDLNGDNSLTAKDLSVMFEDFETASNRADMNNDGTVNVNDLSILLNNYDE